jgi:hypothetical protein
MLNFNEPHPPAENAIEAFNVVLPTIKSEIVKSRRHWDLHEPKMWSRAQKLSDKELVDFTIENDLVEVRALKSSFLKPSFHLLFGHITRFEARRLPMEPLFWGRSESQPSTMRKERDSFTYGE